MVDPVKNTQCGHVYSRGAILNHIRIDPRCPVAGCMNSHVQSSQLVADKQTEHMIRREKIRQKHQDTQMSQNAFELDEDED